VDLRPKAPLSKRIQTGVFLIREAGIVSGTIGMHLLKEAAQAGRLV